MNIKTLFLVCFVLTFFNVITFGQAKDKISKIVIDAGHGGRMPGAVGKLSKEKDINLKVALRVGKLISDNFDDVTVIYTRKNDENVELYKRAEIANKNKADLFISIHCNAAENKDANGVEVFVMGLDKSEASMAVARKENADMLLEKDHETKYSDFDPNSPEAYIVFSLYSSAYLNSSTIFASKVQKHLVNNTKMADRSVRQAGLWVLYRVAMPSILIELGFISNATEEKYLIREDSQELMAISIYNAFVEYKNLVEGTSKPYLPVPKAGKPTPKPEVANVPKAISEEVITTDSATIVEIPQIASTTSEIRFRIQFFTSKDNLKTSDKRFNALPEVKKYNENGVWKYTAGDFRTLEETQITLKEVKKRHSDAFIIAFHNERKISVQEAQDLLK
ncbi:MAG: N-acetylmuramoyl-L-alanine amidase [Bacteroidetes bacterium]|nr:N-acetylmuramoyl-L-alanine amidase [Bacteroidota bacterium]MCL2302109.1 N-acetylmuramoyl-L-alanine amidase [Lentimicrobiaceae bacterium]